MTYEQATNRQTNKQANERTNEQINKQTNFTGSKGVTTVHRFYFLLNSASVTSRLIVVLCSSSESEGDPSPLGRLEFTLASYLVITCINDTMMISQCN